MKDIIESQSFNFSAGRCFDGLVECFPSMNIIVQSQDTETRTLIAYWTYGRIQHSFQTECISINENSTNVKITYRPDIPPARLRPVLLPSVQEYIRAKLNLIFSCLSLSLGIIGQRDFDAIARIKQSEGEELIKMVNRKGRIKEGSFSILIGLVMIFSAGILNNDFSPCLGSLAILAIVSGVSIMLMGVSAPWAIRSYYCPSCGQQLSNIPDPGRYSTCPHCGKRITRSSF